MKEWNVGDRVLHESTGLVGVITNLYPYGKGTDLFPMIIDGNGELHILSVDTIKLIEDKE